jgi:hypothetical protein
VRTVHTDNGTFTVMDRAHLRLDLACGQHPREGFTGVDLRPPDGALQCDLFDTPWPFDENTAGEVHCSHFVEHVPDLIGFMNEMWRVMADGARATLIHPYQHSNRAWQDPTHVRALNEVSWQYYDEDWRRIQSLDHYPITCDFKIVDIQAVVAEDWREVPEKDRRFAMRHYVNVVDDLIVVLEAHKP